MKVTPAIAKELGFEHIKSSNQIWRHDLQLCYSIGVPLKVVIDGIEHKIATRAREGAQFEMRKALGI